MKETHSTASSTVIDPVCGMKVDPARAAGSHQHRGHTYFFCARSCLEKFRSDPSKYLEKPTPASTLIQIGGLTGPPATTAVEDVIYTCPMHPEIRQRGPGSCPKCGMALEPEMATDDEGPNPELIDMTRRFWMAAILSFPVLVLGMTERQT